MWSIVRRRGGTYLFSIVTRNEFYLSSLSSQFGKPSDTSGDNDVITTFSQEMESFLETQTNKTSSSLLAMFLSSSLSGFRRDCFCNENFGDESSAWFPDLKEEVKQISQQA